MTRSLRATSIAALFIATLPALLAYAGGNGNNNGNNGFFNNRAVGGISISPEGVLGLPEVTDVKGLRDSTLKGSAKVSSELNQPVELRKVSLRALEAALAEARASGKDTLPDEVRYLAGIQRIQYVFVLPEENDIVLAGPGEGWKVADNGYVVGVTTGLPVIRLEDLLVAFRTVENARQGGLTCSIDPTEAGLKQFEEVVRATTRMQPGVIPALEKAMGPQTISITGVPESSRFARILVASDFRMKRYAMELDRSPVKGLPSFLSMLKGKKMNNMLPRWWLACNYEPLGKSEDGLAWELRGPGVKVMTEDDFVEAGKVKRSGKANPIAQQWADTLTAKYGELSVRDPIFGELRNVMDLCVISALIHREDLLHKLDLELPNITSEENGVKLRAFYVPKQVDSRCSVTRSGRDYIITASGGVEINSWSVIEKVVESAAVGDLRKGVIGKQGNSLWWN
jgi:hypothetical protein